MIKTILVPTDGSDHAGKAVALASDIAEKYGAKLVILHVLRRGGLTEEARHMAEVEHLAEPAAASAPFAANTPASSAAVLQRARSEDEGRIQSRIGERILGAAKMTARENNVEQIETRMEEGDPVKGILQAAEQTKANLIVMGCRGLSDLKGLLMGSVSHKVSQLAPCTCVTVK